MHMAEEAIEALTKVVEEAVKDIVLTDHVQEKNTEPEEQTRNTEV